MKLYRCKTPTNSLCPCGKVAKALDAAGYEYQTERVPLSSKPEKRENIVQLTGQPKVPVVVFDDGEAVHDSKTIIARVGAR
jgi:glutathione S-transferase